MDYSVFLDALKYVGTSPLTYVAFLVVALVWGVRSYFEHIQKLMQSLDKMPDADKLPFATIVVLGFPKTLSKGRLKVIRERYKLLAISITLVAVIVMIAFFVHAYGMKFEEHQKKIAKLEKGQEDQAEMNKGLEDRMHRLAVLLEKVTTAMNREGVSTKEEDAELARQGQKLKNEAAAIVQEFGASLDSKAKATLQLARKASDKALASAVLRQIGIALDNYQRDSGSSSSDVPSWRIGMYPYLEMAKVGNHNYNPKEPPSSPKNKAFIDNVRNIYLLPGETGIYTNYVVVKHPKPPKGEPSNLAKLADGTSNPVLIIEIRNSGIVWTEDKDLTVDEAIHAIKKKSAEKEGSFALRGDASVIFINNNLSEDQIRRILKGNPTDEQQ